MNKKLVILDSNSLLNRAFYALPPMSNSKGMPTGAVYGFTNMLLKIINDVEPDYIAAAFDKSKITFRHSFYPEYKAGRKKMPDELFAQFEPVKKLLNAFGISIFELESFEADDLIGTISKMFESDNCDVIIYTGDKDALQLVSKYTNVIITKKGISDTDTYTVESLKERYGFDPSGIIELKGLMGDASDNIPGVPGVGEKTALKLLDEYKNIENIYDNIDNISGKKLKENLVQYRDSAFLSKKLATINRQVPLNLKLEDMNIKGYNTKEIVELFTEYEFKSLIDKIKMKKEENQEEISFLPEVNKTRKCSEIVSAAKKSGKFNFIFIFKNKILDGIMTDDSCLIDADELSGLKEIFESDTIVKNTDSAKMVYNELFSRGIILRNLGFDTQIAAYLLNPTESSYTITDMLYRY